MMIFEFFPCIYFVVSRIISIFALVFERYERQQDKYSIDGVLAQLARASALQAEGRGFELHILHKKFTNIAG